MQPTLIRNTISRSAFRLAFFLIPLVLACFGLSTIAMPAQEAVVPGFGNTAEGFQALQNNATAGSSNTADGYQALYFTTTGTQSVESTAIGFRALFHNTTGHDNTALGLGAGQNLTTGTNNLDIGNPGVAGESSTIRIGSSSQIRTFIAGINGIAVTGTTVQVNAAGQLGVAPSSRRFKDEIKPMDKESEAILALKPVTFRYKKEIDPDRTPQFGLVAEEVAKVNPDLVARDANGDVYTVRYDAVNAMSLNEFLKEHRKVQEHDASIEQLQSMVAKQEKDMKALITTANEQSSELREVSAQFEASKPRPQVAGNGR
jgi:hypothetical protein